MYDMYDITYLAYLACPGTARQISPVAKHQVQPHEANPLPKRVELVAAKRS